MYIDCRGIAWQFVLPRRKSSGLKKVIQPENHFVFVIVQKQKGRHAGPDSLDNG